MKRLYTVTLETTIVVVAENEGEAEGIALGRSSYDLGSTYDDLEAEVWSSFSLPHGWNERCIPFGGDGRSIAEWLAAEPSSGESKP